MRSNFANAKQKSPTLSLFREVSKRSMIDENIDDFRTIKKLFENTNLTCSFFFAKKKTVGGISSLFGFLVPLPQFFKYSKKGVLDRKKRHLHKSHF